MDLSPWYCFLIYFSCQSAQQTKRTRGILSFTLIMANGSCRSSIAENCDVSQPSSERGCTWMGMAEMDQR